MSTTVSALSTFLLKGACSNPQPYHPISFQTYGDLGIISLVIFRRLHVLCVKFHAQTRCSLEISEKLSRKLENMDSTIL